MTNPLLGNVILMATSLAKSGNSLSDFEIKYSLDGTVVRFSRKRNLELKSISIEGIFNLSLYL